MAKMIFVNLPVADVEASAVLYEAIGFARNPQFSQPGQAAAMVWSDTIHVMLLSHDFFRGFLPGDRTIADAGASAQTLLCLSFNSREAVDRVTQAAADAGGRADIRAAQDMGFMYGRAFADLDGHIFEPIWMDVAAAQDAPADDSVAA
jgi:predicted lactoylglutathione lyase